MPHSYSSSVALSERVQIKCPECGEKRSLSSRQARRAGRCPYCRYPLRIEITDRYRRYWLDRYTLPEIRFMAGAIFGELEQRQAMVASARQVVEDNGER